MEQNSNKMKEIIMDKLVINIGTGNDTPKQLNAKKLLQLITGRNPTDEISTKRIPSFKIANGTKIGAFVTIRKGQKELAKKLFDAVGDKIKDSSVSDNTVSFGIKEYIDIDKVKYDPSIGMLGMNVNLSFKRRGMHVRDRKRKSADVPAKHRVIPSEEIKEYLRKEFKIEFI
jgi:large subunit ribosomal protein L5